MEKWRVGIKFSSSISLQGKLKERFGELKEENDMCIGYVEPGHGWRGKQRWITADEDLRAMYDEYRGKKEVLLWCLLPGEEKHTASGKRQRKPEGGDSTSKHSRCSEANAKKMSETKDTVSKLQAQHGAKYTPEQLHAWAQLIQCNKHQSYDQPPNFPFFKGNRSSNQADATDQTPIKQSMSFLGSHQGNALILGLSALNNCTKLLICLRKEAFLNSSMTSSMV